MNTPDLIAEIDAEIARLEEARNLLTAGQELLASKSGQGSRR